MSLTKIAKELKRDIINIANKSQSPHVGSALSCIDILCVLYYKILKLEDWENRDIFILSKAHAAMALYAILTKKGIMHKDMIDGYYQNNGTLPTHLDITNSDGIEVSAGSLGHGFNIGLGMAYSYKKSNINRKVYAVIGDGESQEGSIWEGAMFASFLQLSNFTAILDYNNLQGYGRANEICSFEPIVQKWESFGWYVIAVDGHNHTELENALNKDSGNKPKIIIAKTTKGKDVSFMEDQLIWHYYMVTDEHKRQAIKELQ